MTSTSLAAALGLNHTEGQIVMRLITQSCLSREQICAIASRAHQPIKIGSVNALITGVRKKLRGHRVEISTLNGFGFELRKADRAKVRELLAKPTRGAAVEDPPEAQGSPPVRFFERGPILDPDRRTTNVGDPQWLQKLKTPRKARKKPKRPA